MSGGTHPDVQTDMPKLGRYRVRTDVVSSSDGCYAYYPGSWNPGQSVSFVGVLSSSIVSRSRSLLFLLFSSLILVSYADGTLHHL